MDPDLVRPVLVLGLLQAGLYGLLPISIVLSYRISRTIAFVHGGIAIWGALSYGLLIRRRRPGRGRRCPVPAGGPVSGAVRRPGRPERPGVGVRGAGDVAVNRTYTGLAIRAIADDLEANVWCGTRLRLVGTGTGR